MSDFESKIDINIDAGQALAAIKTLQRQISDFHTSLAKGSATANIKSLQMQQTLVDTINSTGQFSAQMKTVASSTQAFSTALEKNKLSMGQYFKYAGGASKSFGRFFKTEMDTIQKVAIERVKDLQTQYIKMGRDASGALKTIAVRPLALDMENLATKTQVAAQKQQLLNQLLKQGSTNLLNFGKNTQWAGRQLMVGFTIPLGIMGTTAAKTFMQMEEQAIKFKRVYGDTFTATAETDAMVKQIQQLASEFTKYGVAVEKTMEQAATAAAAGKMGADLLAQVTESTRLSVLGNVEQQQALETTISLTNAFGTASDKLREKINFLNAVENQTVTSIEDLTTAIPKAAPVIQQLGGDVEDLTFFLTAMREGGINASESANALKSGLASLINPTKKASDFMAGFGININKIVEGNKGDVKGLVIDFAKALDTLDPLNRARAIEQLFGKFQFSRLSTLFQNVIKDGSQAARVLELTRQSSAELGILAQRELAKVSSSPMYKFQKAIADFKKELAPVGEEFLKAVTPIIQFGTDILKAFNSMDSGVKQFVINATGLIAGIGPIFLMTFGLLANGVANVIKGFTFVKNIFNKASSASTILGETTDYMTQQQLEAASVAASLEQVHNKLTQAFTVETTAVNNLTSAYQKAVAAQTAFTGPNAVGKRGAKPKKYANGVFSVPGPKGAGDVVPAMLSPGEAVIPAKMATRYSGFISGMISGNIPGFNKGKTGGSSTTKAPIRRKSLADMIKDIGSDQPRYLTDQTMGLMHPDFANEQQVVRDAFAAQGFDIVGNERDRKSYGGYTQAHAAHLGSSRRQVTVDTKNGKLSRWIKNWAAKDITPNLGMMNKYVQDISDPDIEEKSKDPKQKGKRVAVYRKFMQEDSIKRVAKALKIPVGEVRKHAKHLFAGNEALTPRQTAVLGEIAKTHQETIKVTNNMSKQTRAEVARTTAVQNVAARRLSLADSVKGFFKGRGAYKENESKRVAYEKVQEQKLQAAGNRATAAEVKASNDRTVKAKAESKTAKAETAVAKGKEKAAKTQQKTTKKQTQSRVAATPTVSSKETVGDGITKTSGIDKNGKPFVQYHEGRKRLSNAEAESRIAGASGAAAKPGSRFKSMFSGKTGKVGAAGLIASILGGTVGGPGGDFLSTAGNAAIVASTIKSFMPEGAGANFRQGAIGKRIAPLIDNVAVKFAELTPKLIKFGKFFGGPLALAATAAMMIYDAATADLRKRAEINAAIYNTLNTTQARLEKINEFFGTTAKLSSARTMQMIPVGFNDKKAFSVADEFRKSEQFQTEYRDNAQKLIGATNEEFTLAMESLAVDLVASGVGEEQSQAIIDAIKMEAKKTDVVIEVKSLALDTKEGFDKAKANVATSLENFGNEIGDYFNVGGYSISEVMEGRSKGWLESFFGGFTSFNTDVLINQIKQVSNTLNGVSAAYLSASITGEQFDDQLASLADGISSLEPAAQVEAYDAILTDLNPVVAELANKINDTASYALILKSVLAGITFSPEIIDLLATGTEENIAAVTAAYNKAKAAQDAQLAQKKALQSQQKSLQKQQEKIQNNEDAINKKYDDRIRALERIEALNEKISQQQKNQLDLADALSQGDVFGAAQAVQQMRADDAAYAMEQQKNVLEDQRRKELGVQEKAANNIEKQQASIQDQIATIQNAVINIDKYLVMPSGKAGDVNTGQGLQDAIARQRIIDANLPGVSKKDIDWFFKEGKKGKYEGGFDVGGAPSKAVYDMLKAAYENAQINAENSNTGSLNAINVGVKASDIKSSVYAGSKGNFYDWQNKNTPGTKQQLPNKGLFISGDQANQFTNTANLKRGMLIQDINGNTYTVSDLIASNQNAQFPNIIMVDPVKKAAGGYISGPGSGTSDSIPARLSNGEYVIRAKAVNALGTDVLDKMNHAEKFAKGGIVNKPKTGSTASIYSDDKSVEIDPNNPMSAVSAGLNFVMNSIYESLFGKWAVKTKQGTPTAPDLEDAGTMAMNIVPIPGMKSLKIAGAGAKGFMQTGTVAGAKAAQSGAKLKALDSFSLSSPLTRQGVEIGEMAKHIPTQSDYYLKAYKSDTAVQMPYKGINEPLAYWLSQRLGSDVVPYEFLKFGKGAGETIGPFGMVKDSATLVASKINKNLITGMLGNNALMNSPQMEKIFLNAYKQGGPEALKKAIQEYLASIQKYADNTSLLNTLFSNADIHGKNVMYDTASKAITQLDFGHAGLFTDLLSGSYSKLPTKFSYLNDFYTKNPLEGLSPGDLGYDVIKLEQGLQSFLLDASRTIPELPEIMSSINAGKTIMNPDNFLKGLSNLYKSGDPLEAFVKDASMGDRGLEKWLTSMLLKDVQGISGKTNISKSFADVVDDMIKFVPSLLKKLPKVENWFNVPGMTPKKPLGKSGVVDIQVPNVGNEFKPWHTGPQAKNGGLVKFAKGGLVKRDVASSDSGLDWFNSFIQNLLGGGNPSAAMQNDATKLLLAQSYTQGAKNMGVDPTDPMFYASMFGPSMGIKALGVAGKGVSKLKGLSASKNTGPRVTLANYIDTPRVSQAYLNFMRTNPAISVRMRSEQLIDKLAKKDFAYRNAFEEGMVVDDLDPRLEAEKILFGLGKDADPSSRPIYGAGVSPYTPWSIRGKASRNDNAFERWALRSNASNINSKYFDRYGDISLLLKNRVKKRSTFTLGDSFGARERDSYIPGGPKKTVAAPFGTMSQSKILGAATGMSRPDLQFVEAQIFGGLPFSDIKKIIVKNPEMIPLLQQKLAEAGLKIPVGQTKLSPLGKLNEMFYKNKVHGPTGLPMFIPQYKSGGMFRTPYANGGLAMLHDKEFVMNPGAVKEYGVDKLKAMNNGTYNSGSVYNSYGVNISVGGSNADASEIARTVIKEIKKIDAQQIRSTKV
jgi:TP901 family phage tail tape measure protein